MRKQLKGFKQEIDTVIFVLWKDQSKDRKGTRLRQGDWVGDHCRHPRKR